MRAAGISIFCRICSGTEVEKGIMKKLQAALALLLVLASSVVLFGGCDMTGRDDSKDTFNPDDPSRTSEPDTDPGPQTPKYFNKLTGEGSDTDLSQSRPVGIMINNIKVSCPQEGISNADVIYECLAEGGITRMLMFADDYADLPAVGSIRSSRDYYLDFAQDFDAIYVHCGGSEYAYEDISERDIDNIDGVKGPGALWNTTDTFYRDADRRANMGYEHSVMTTGAGLAAGIKYMGCRTELKSDYDSPFDFVEYGQVEKFENVAPHVRFSFSSYQTVDYVYDEASGEYLRYQHGGVEHIDGSTGQQLSFENVIIIFCDMNTVDSKGRLTVQTTGSGSGYYITEGTYIPITWSKSSRDGQIEYFKEDGTALLMNRGKTFVNVCGLDVDVDFDYEWNQ